MDFDHFLWSKFVDVVSGYGQNGQMHNSKKKKLTTKKFQKIMPILAPNFFEISMVLCVDRND